MTKKIQVKFINLSVLVRCFYRAGIVRSPGIAGQHHFLQSAATIPRWPGQHYLQLGEGSDGAVDDTQTNNVFIT